MFDNCSTNHQQLIILVVLELREYENKLPDVVFMVIHMVEVYILCVGENSPFLRRPRFNTPPPKTSNLMLWGSGTPPDGRAIACY